MSSLLDIFEKNNLSLSLEYYGKEDLATKWEIKIIIEHPEIFNDFFSRFELKEIEEVEDYFIYLLSLKFVDLKNIVALIIDEENKEKIEFLSIEAEKTLKKINNGQIIKFINGNIANIFEDQLMQYNIRSRTLDLIEKYWVSISKEVFEYLIEYYSYMLIDRYANFEKLFEKNTDLFSKLIPNSGFINTSMRYESILDIFSHILKSKNSNLKDLVESIVDGLYQELQKSIQDISGREIMEREHYVRKFYEFLNDIKSPKAVDFSEIHEDIKDKLDIYLENEGQKFSYDIPVKEILESWSNQKNPAFKLLMLTHHFNEKDQRRIFESQLARYEKDGDPLMDLFSTNIAIDNYFTLSHQQALGILSSIETATFLEILQQEEYFQEYVDLTCSAIKYIEEKLRINNEVFTKDVKLLYVMLKTIIINKTATNEVLRSIYYSASMFISAFIEKILRITYEFLAKGELYFQSEQARLGHLLHSSNKTTSIVFNEIHKKHLLYFLSRVGDKQIGRNYRNDLAHLTNNIEDKLSINLVAVLLWLLTDVTNSIFTYVLKEMD